MLVICCLLQGGYILVVGRNGCYSCLYIADYIPTMQNSGVSKTHTQLTFLHPPSKQDAFHSSRTYFSQAKPLKEDVACGSGVQSEESPKSQTEMPGGPHLEIPLQLSFPDVYSDWQQLPRVSGRGISSSPAF